MYNFGAVPDGNYPQANLIDVGGTLYGTTRDGGKYGWGTVFSITPGGAENVLYSFKNGNDGSRPSAGLVELGDVLYGTTSEGGGPYNCGYSYRYYGCGTVFSVTLSGTEKVLHSFGYPISDGRTPQAGLTGVNGTLYGTTQLGGSYRCAGYGFDCGTVFSITRSGTEQVLHRFGNAKDGGQPQAPLINVKGRLYGTTAFGGAYNWGTVFRITTGGTETVLHSFGAATDGMAPYAGLLDVKGTLYGTTTYGPNGCNLFGACGTLFSITPNGTEKVIHAFGRGNDGAASTASLIKVRRKLYGTTVEGGPPYVCYDGNRCGTVFSITTRGKETVLHNFGHGADGVWPAAGLTNVGGVLYGTTPYGGTYQKGTVFELIP
ncbi:MAG: hypothetical protein JO351_10585 [Candidatus Eremiobacteraeota bacterium]|nr:hypothetical protein [Candidatus Eremiobacteraeota bacterium]MBV9057066.1 hypothetical protein [Candidatus Eremiobacteraeota bacterium]